MESFTPATSPQEPPQYLHSLPCGYFLSAWPRQCRTGLHEDRWDRNPMLTSGSVCVKRWRVAILICELALFALILILPQVALPDFTAQGGTSPAVQTRRLTSPPGPAITLVLQPMCEGTGQEKLRDHTLDRYSSSPSS